MGILDLIYPKKCLECKTSVEYICSKCLKKVRKAISICLVCNRPSLNGRTHKKCKRPHTLDQLISGWKYEGVIRKALLALKYKYVTDVAEELITKYLKELKTPVPKKAILVPIPMHPKRKKWRGFNQAEELGKIITKKLDWDYIPDLLIRTRYTKPQTELKGEARKKNVVGVFKVNPDYRDCNNIILFDDVTTTGSTLKEAGKILKMKGVKKVKGFTITR